MPKWPSIGVIRCHVHCKAVGSKADVEQTLNVTVEVADVKLTSIRLAK